MKNSRCHVQTIGGYYKEVFLQSCHVIPYSLRSIHSVNKSLTLSSTRDLYSYPLQLDVRICVSCLVEQPDVGINLTHNAAGS